MSLILILGLDLDLGYRFSIDGLILSWFSIVVTSFGGGDSWIGFVFGYGWCWVAGFCESEQKGEVEEDRFWIFDESRRGEKKKFKILE